MSIRQGIFRGLVIAVVVVVGVGVVAVRNTLELLDAARLQEAALAPPRAGSVPDAALRTLAERTSREARVTIATVVAGSLLTVLLLALAWRRIVRDMNARQSATASCARARRGSAGLVRNVPVGVIVQDAETRITLANPKALELLGPERGRVPRQDVLRPVLERRGRGRPRPRGLASFPSRARSRRARPSATPCSASSVRAAASGSGSS